jgi:hypothetical protein
MTDPQVATDPVAFIVNPTVGLAGLGMPLVTLVPAIEKVNGRVAGYAAFAPRANHQIDNTARVTRYPIRLTVNRRGKKVHVAGVNLL